MPFKIKKKKPTQKTNCHKKVIYVMRNDKRQFSAPKRSVCAFDNLQPTIKDTNLRSPKLSKCKKIRKINGF